MKRLFQLGILLGFAGTLAGVYFMPLISYERFASEADVVANGGRSESFLIRLPADRIAGDPTPSRLHAAGGAPAGSDSLIEHFKLRDVKGNVIGVAARHWSVVAGQATAVWVLAIPSRGTVAAAGAAEAPGAVEAALRKVGWQPGHEFAGSASLDLVPHAQSVAATGEFGGIQFDLAETMAVTGVEGSGAVRGTITLATIGRRSQ